MTTNTADRVLDVRAIDGPPFDDIVSALEALEPDDRLQLIVPFEPVPLYEVLERRGFTYESDQQPDDLWHVHIEHDR